MDHIDFKIPDLTALASGDLHWQLVVWDVLSLQIDAYEVRRTPFAIRSFRCILRSLKTENPSKCAINANVFALGVERNADPDRNDVEKSFQFGGAVMKCGLQARHFGFERSNSLGVRAFWRGGEQGVGRPRPNGFSVWVLDFQGSGSARYREATPKWGVT